MADQNEVVARDRVAVVTGAASGIGLGLSERFAAEGMRVVMADVEEAALKKAADRLVGEGAKVEPVVVDVAKAEQVDRLRDRAVDAFGAVHLLCNNAGVGGSTGPLWLISPGEWEWVLGVNLGGVVNGVRSFMPLLLDQDAAHVVNTASIFGVFAGALGPYSVSKHAVVAYTESLYFQLRDAGARVGVSVLCPGAVQTRFGDSARNRPPDVGPPPDPGPNDRAQSERLAQLTPMGRDPSEVADIVVDGVRSSRFYILTSTNRNEAVRRRGEEVVAGAPPRDPFP
jgi:NAD(P)-dependent dehydrogenase (short-subunit alcohol dehydrogenase family)